MKEPGTSEPAILATLLDYRYGRGGMNSAKSLSLREIADSTKRESAPPAKGKAIKGKLIIFAKKSSLFKLFQK